VWLLGLATGGCQSCCNDSHGGFPITVTDEQIARGFPPAVCYALCTAAARDLDTSALDAPDQDTGIAVHWDFDVACSLSGHQLICDRTDHCPPQ